MVMDCIFCKIIAKEIPASMVYEDEIVSAFMDIQPVNSGHVLVIPKKHSANLADLDPEAGSQMFITARNIAEALRKTDIKCEGINLFLADGAVAGQEVFHCHLHVIPRHKNDGFGFKFRKDYLNLPERKELDINAGKIRDILVNS
jgi:histidine triad (HIT) family protein